MTRIFPAALAALVLTAAPAAQSDLQNPLSSGEVFYTGCNYWASNAGMYMWRRWDPKAVEKDIAELSRNGVNIMRVFPLWPDFQPLTRMLGGGGTDKGLAQNDGPLQNPAGVDEEMMRRFRFMCDVSQKHDVKLVVGLITGWMSGRLFVPPAFEAKNVLLDAEVMTWQTRFVRHFVREMKDHPAILGWDLGNECNCMAGKDIGPYESWMWLNTIASAIRAEDATRPVVSGMHGCSNVKSDRWNLSFQGELMDELTTHPYPLFTPYCAKDPFNTMRSETHPAAESLLYWGLSGKHCFVEEAGDLGRCTGSPERSAANARCAMFTSWANGLGAYVWWCGFDQQHLDFPPYTWNAVERELGLFTRDYEPKPVLRAMGAFRKFLADLPPEIAKLPPRQVDAVVLVSDRERAWASAFGAYLLARQAGFDVAYADAPAVGRRRGPLQLRGVAGRAREGGRRRHALRLEGQQHALFGAPRRDGQRGGLLLPAGARRQVQAEGPSRPSDRRLVQHHHGRDAQAQRGAGFGRGRARDGHHMPARERERRLLQLRH